MTKQLIAGNWKMFMRTDSALELASGVAAAAASQDAADVAVFPPLVYLKPVVEAVSGTPLAVGAQNVYWEEEGAFTGEIAARMLADIGCTCVIVGHSERRTLFGETDETVNRRTRAVLNAGLLAIVCVGETLEQHEAGDTKNVVSSQLRGALAGFEPESLRDLTLAYEPVWAIGTGRTATPEQAEEVHAMMSGILEDEFGIGPDQGVRILYGGSVKPENAADILAQPHIDGALVGGASLKVDAFSAIINAARVSG